MKNSSQEEKNVLKNVKKITEKKADYTIALKENQPTLYKNVGDYFSSAITEKQFYPEVSSSQTIEQD